MFLHSKQAGALIKILDAEELIDPLKNAIRGRIQEGEEEQEPEQFSKEDLTFPSGENLPRCWIDVDYRNR